MATNYAKASYTEIYDLSTQVGETSILKFHTPQGNGHRQMLRGFFQQFKHYRYTGCTATLIPVATLPADPLQISYEAGEPTIDPRDLVNPIVHKGYKGERLKSDAFPNNTAVGDVQDGYSYPYPTDGGVDEIVINPDTTIDNNSGYWYYDALTDPSFKKSHVQRGFKQSMYPLVRGVGTNYQLAPSAEYNPVGNDPDPTDVHDIFGVDGSVSSSLPSNLYAPHGPNGSGGTIARPDLEIFSHGWRKLGWLDTSSNIRSPTSSGAGLMNSDSAAPLPKVFMYMAMMPPAYKQEMYFRLVVTHYFEFKSFRSARKGGIEAYYDAMIDSMAPADEIAVVAPPSARITPLAIDSQSIDVENGKISLKTVGVA